MPQNFNIPLPAEAAFRKKIADKETGLFLLKNKNNVQAAITNYGARWVSMLVPAKNGDRRDVVLGFDAIEGYIRSTEAYYGATVGRYANRIARGHFTLNGTEYQLAINNPPNHLHGGVKAFHAVIWDVVHVKENNIRLRYLSTDGEENYPGNLEVFVEYTLTEENEMRVDFTGNTDKATIVNLTQHAYFNLNGQGSGTVLQHLLTIHADHFTPIDKTSIPLGTTAPVAGTPFDFRLPGKIGDRINEPDEQITNGSGYDHNFVLNRWDGSMQLAAVAAGDESGIKMEVFTTEPGIQLYTGNFMNDENVLKSGYTDGRREAFCLETQHFPDSPNHPNFPSAVLHPGETYRTATVFRFS
jgi:aldose 1-epimerase